MSVRPRPLFEVLSDSLCERMCAHELMPGETLDEYRLATSYGVSRSAVREALSLLLRNGLVEFNSRGFHVASPTRQDVSQLFDVLELLEGFAMRQAADARRPPDEGCQFWPGLCQASGNPYLANQIDDAVTRLKLACGPLLESPDMQPSKALQEELRQFILKGRADQAEQVLSGYWRQRRQGGMAILQTRHGSASKEHEI
ncbi:GntR family transcriptional regulator [Zoogloea sp.]|uniref:GntR family transcriptional regulator n=1 Tax=Zoogloea sp. TaxID=49181 RepID=UPI0025E29C4C|nr:GntR family transcriptional regulator [Zoogloea sp.]MCK6395728.1 GntR family transcriptional regulator [Zoogloea sp.]